MAGEHELLVATTTAGFIAPATMAAALALQERIVLELLARLGGEAHLPYFAENLAEPAGQHLVAEFDEDRTTYVLRLVDDGA